MDDERMPRRSLTDKQQEVLEYLAECSQRGLMPITAKEISEHLFRRPNGNAHEGTAVKCLQSLANKGFIIFDGEWPKIIGDTENIMFVSKLRVALAKYGRHDRKCAVSRHAHRVECDCGFDDAKRI